MLLWKAVYHSNSLAALAMSTVDLKKNTSRFDCKDTSPLLDDCCREYATDQMPKNLTYLLCRELYGYKSDFHRWHAVEMSKMQIMYTLRRKYWGYRKVWDYYTWTSWVGTIPCNNDFQILVDVHSLQAHACMQYEFNVAGRLWRL